MHAYCFSFVQFIQLPVYLIIGLATGSESFNCTCQNNVTMTVPLSLSAAYLSAKQIGYFDNSTLSIPLHTSVFLLSVSLQLVSKP